MEINNSKPVFRIEYEEEALDDLDDLPQKVQSQIIKAAKKLIEDPRPSGSRQLKGYKNLFRLRTGDYRIIYTIENDVLVVLVVAVGARKNIYELLKRRIS